MPRKRIKSKIGALRQKAEDAWLAFWIGGPFESDLDKIFDSRDEARQAWELVRGEYLKNNPLTEPPHYGPGGFWIFDTPEPFKLNLDDSDKAERQKRQALIKWGLLEIKK